MFTYVIVLTVYFVVCVCFFCGTVGLTNNATESALIFDSLPGHAAMLILVEERNAQGIQSNPL